jgi:tetratricopeptide (TPR) repeat protein
LMSAYAAVSLAWATHPDTSQLLPWFTGGALGTAAGGLPADERKRLATRVALVVASGSAVWLLLAFARGERGMALHGGHGNPDWAGLAMAAAAPLLIEGYRVAAHRLERRLYATAAILSLPALFLSGSRTALIALLLVALVFTPGRRRWLLAAPAALALSYLAIGTELGAAWHGRLWLWRSSAHAAAAALPIGHGQGDFGFAYLDAQGPLLAQLSLDEAALRFVNATTAHNDWLQALVEGGLPQLLLLATTLLLATAGLWSRWRGGATCVAVVGICSLGDAALMQPAVVTLLCLVLASTPLSKPRGAWFEGAAATLLLVTLAVALPGGVRNWLSARALAKVSRYQPDDRVTGLEQVIAFAPDSGEANLALGLAQLEQGDRVSALQALGPLQRSRQLLANVSTDVALGNAHLVLADSDAAIDSYNRALTRHPAMFRARINLAEALRRADNLEGAERELTAARELQPNHPKLQRTAEQLRRDRIDAATR